MWNLYISLPISESCIVFLLRLWTFKVTLSDISTMLETNLKCSRTISTLRNRKYKKVSAFGMDNIFKIYVFQYGIFKKSRCFLFLRMCNAIKNRSSPIVSGSSFLRKIVSLFSSVCLRSTSFFKSPVQVRMFAKQRFREKQRSVGFVRFSKCSV